MQVRVCRRVSVSVANWQRGECGLGNCPEVGDRRSMVLEIWCVTKRFGRLGYAVYGVRVPRRLRQHFAIVGCVLVTSCASGSGVMRLPVGVITKVTDPPAAQGADSGSLPDADAAAAGSNAAGGTEGTDALALAQVPLEANTRFRSAPFVDGVELHFTTPPGESYTSTDDNGYFQVTNDLRALHVVVALMSLRTTYTWDDAKTPIREQFQAGGGPKHVTDVLQWLAARPFLKATAVTGSVQIGGIDADAFDYIVDDLPADYRACDFILDAPRCAWIFSTFGPSQFGVFYSLNTNERGRAYRFAVDGVPFLLFVADTDEARAVAASLAFRVTRIPKEMQPAALLTKGVLEPGVYFASHVAAHTGVALSTSMALVAATRNFVALGDTNLAVPAPPPGVPGTFLLKAALLSAVAMRTTSDATLDFNDVSDPSAMLARTEEIPADFLGFVAKLGYLSVVQQAHDVAIPGADTARAMVVHVAADVTGPCASSGATCATIFVANSGGGGLSLEHDTTYQIVDIHRGDEHIVVVASVDPAGAAIVDSLRLVSTP